ncbi:MAG: hypothetical protein JO017_10525, partial [Actinobacteria bacterium]|nr:hypothetical protein [Actinomycetota bacterium]
AFHPVFYSLRATAGDVAILGVPGVTLSAARVDVEVNGGGTWAFGSATVAVDFADTFGPSGYTIQTGTNPPITLHASGDLVSASADQILLTIGSFVYIDGGFSFSKGAVTTVDVSTGLSLVSAEEALVFGSLPMSATNPGGGELAVTADGSEIWNVPVDTLELGLGNVNVFAGYANGLALDPATHTLDSNALTAANAVGLYLSGGDLGLALMRSDFPLAVLAQSPALYASGMKFTALRTTGDSVGLVGIPDITLSATNFEVDYNDGSAGSLWPGTPTADFVSTFGAGGLLVPDDTSGDTIGLNFSGGVVGASADNVLLRLGGFVYVSGSFAFTRGNEQWVDVASGIAGAVAATEFVGVSEYDTDPGGHTLGHNADGSMIWNLPVDTINIGIGNASVFVGYSTGLTPTGPNGTLTVADLQNANGIGMLMSGVNIGLVLMKEAGILDEAPLAVLLDNANLRFYALTASAATAGIFGIPGVTATATGIQVRINEGEAGSAYAGGLVGATPIVNFVASFGSGGYQVPLSTSGFTGTVAIPYTDEEIGASADQVLFQISQFVYLSGSFSFDKGPTLLVAVETGLTHDEAAANGLFTGISTATSAPTDGSLAITPDGSELWNVPVGSITVGIASGNIFVGYANGSVPLDSNGNISKSGLLSQGSVGLFMSNVAIGLALLRAPPLSNILIASSVAAAAVSAAEFNFLSLKGTAGNVALVGIPDITLSSTNLEVQVNEGNAAGVWVGNLFGESPVVNFQDSFPTTGGLQIPTDTSGVHPPVTLDYADSIVEVSADNVLLQIGGFVYISGSFNFSEGQEQWVDVATGIGGALATGEFVGVTRSDTDPGGHTLAVKSDGSMLWNLPVDTINIGIGSASVFVGYSTGLTPTGPNGTLTVSDLQNANGIGMLMSNVNLGLVLMQEASILGEAPLAVLLDNANLRFYALTASATAAGIYGIPDVTASATGIQIR